MSNKTMPGQPKPIPPPAMNDNFKSFSVKLLGRLLREYKLSTFHCDDDGETKHWPSHLTICGLGSLLSEKSARRTFPDLVNFRKGFVKNYVRCFNLVAISSLQFGDLEKNKIASLSAVSNEELSEETFQSITSKQGLDYVEMSCTLFEIPLSPETWHSYLTREHRYDFRFVPVHSQDGKENTCQHALICYQYNDECYRTKRCCSYENEFYERVTQHFSGQLWYHTSVAEVGVIPIKPIPKYLELCFNAALEMGLECLKNFLITSVMADGRTLLLEYIRTEEPDLYEKYIIANSLESKKN